MANLDQIIRVALQNEPADLVLKNGKVINVFSHEILSDLDIAIVDGYIAGLGKGYRGKEEIDVQDKFICPGFIDGHLHIESTLLSPEQFAKAVLPKGTTTVICDPHEIANVWGAKGIEYMLLSSENLPVTIFVMLPSCVPATFLETSGATLRAEDLKPFLQHPRVLGLAEMMNYPGVLAALPDVLEKLNLAKEMLIDGHAPGLSGKKLQAYVGCGISSDHECTDLEEAREKLRLGMYIMLRQGSSEHNLVDLLPLVSPMTISRCMFVSDDKHPHDLLETGHLDYNVRLAIEHGLDPLLAIQAVTLTPAQRFGLRDRGAIAPGYRADLLVLDDLQKVEILHVIAGGQVVVKNKELLFSFDGHRAVISKSELTISRDLDFRIPVRGEQIRVIELVCGQILTRELRQKPKVEQGLVVSDPARDILKLAVIERHKATGNVGLGFVHGFALRSGALASTVSHDSHNLIVVGANDQDMLLAIETLRKSGGGFAVVNKGQVKACLPLPIAGLMSDRSLEEVALAMKDIETASQELAGIPNAFMLLSFLALPVIPSLRLTDKGLVDVNHFKLVDLFV
ncbi:MAG: adenine deaminase [Desulfonauticus sp.]|nr:adenine deaminase [Desulfonauticus sp.]